MAKLVGYEQADFTTMDGTVVKCKKLYIGLPLSGPDNAGMRVITLFASERKLANAELPIDEEVYVDYSWDAKRKKYRFHGITSQHGTNSK